MSEKQLPALRNGGYNLQINTKEDLTSIAQILVSSGLCSEVKDEAQAIYKIMWGGELGLPPIASMNGIYFQTNKKKIWKNGKEDWIEIQKPAMLSAMMACLIKKSGRYNFKILKNTNEESAIEVFEFGNSVGVSTFTIEDAKKAELLAGKNADNYRKYPKNMLHSRNISNIAKMYCTDVFGGQPVYTPEELDIVVDAETGEPIEDAPVKETKKQMAAQVTSITAASVEQSPATDKASATTNTTASTKNTDTPPPSTTPATTTPSTTTQTVESASSSTEMPGQEQKDQMVAVAKSNGFEGPDIGSILKTLFNVTASNMETDFTWKVFEQAVKWFQTHKKPDLLKGSKVTKDNIAQCAEVQS